MGNRNRWDILGQIGYENNSLLGRELHPITYAILENRGITADDDIEKFFHPNLSGLYDPYLLNDMDKAVVLIKHSIDSKKKIIIYGDYDADGITSTSLLLRCLKTIGGDAGYYIPNRLGQGYGLNIQAVNEIISNGAGLIITVDCGISAINEVQFCREHGTDIIITDHHECNNILPDAIIINPKRRDSLYPFKELAGAGVAFKLVQAMKNIYNEINLYDYLDLAAIGTIADVVPIINENRILAKCGLESMKSTRNYGIRALFNAANIELSTVTGGEISYAIAPRINAVGRIDTPNIGVDLFTCDNAADAEKLSNNLNDANKRRQAIEEQILIDAEKKLSERDMNSDFAIVLQSENWHIGVVGIVASRLVEKYNKPVVLLCREGNICRGSARSITGFNIFQAFNDCSDILIKFGGHELAAGLSISINNVEGFIERFNNIAGSKQLGEASVPIIKVDCEISSEDITIGLIDELKLFEPYGISNPLPLFLFKSLNIVDLKTVGAKCRHLKMKLDIKHITLDAIAFNMGYNINEYSKNGDIDIICSLDRNIWNGKESIQLVVKDMRSPLFRDVENSYNKSFTKLLSSINIEDYSDVNRISKFDFISKPIKCIIQEALVRPNSLLLVSNRDILICLLDYQESLNICFQDSHTFQEGKAVMIINPDVSSICMDDISDVYLMDSIVNLKLLNNFSITDKQNIKWHICNAGTDNDVDFLNSIKPSRQSLEKVYKHFKDRTIECSIDKISETLLLDRLCTYYCLKVLNELNIFSISAKSDGNIMISTNKQAKSKIEDSWILKKFDYLIDSLKTLNTFIQKTKGE